MVAKPPKKWKKTNVQKVLQQKGKIFFLASKFKNLFLFEIEKEEREKEEREREEREREEREKRERERERVIL